MPQYNAPDDPYKHVMVPGWDNIGPLTPTWSAKWFVREAKPLGGTTEAVLKLIPDRLKNNKKQLDRFYAEATEAYKLRDVYGVLPLLDIDRTDPAKPEWYVTPRARMLREQTDKALALQTVVELISNVAAILERLAQRGIYHRDIKPANIFWHDNAPAVGDFGIALWPGIEGRTRADERLGPEAFLAPEMRQAGRASDTTRADVYSLSKTLFALAMALEYPPDGTHRTDAEQFNFSRRWKADHAGAGKALTHVLEAATAYYVEDRLTMAEFSGELDHWLTQYPERITLKEPEIGPVRSGWGPITNYQRDLAETGVSLFRAGITIARALGSDSDPREEDHEHPVAMLGTGDWPVNSPEGFEPDGSKAIEVRIQGYSVALVSALWGDEVATAAEVRTTDQEGNPTGLVEEFGPTPWSRARMPSTQAHLNHLFEQVMGRLAAELNAARRPAGQ